MNAEPICPLSLYSATPLWGEFTICFHTLATSSKPAANKARASLRLGAPSTSLCGYIKVANATTGQCIGYVSKNFDARGEYVVDKWNFAVEVAFSAYTTGLTNLISMYNSPAPSTRSLSPYIGASIAGYSADLGATSPNYAVLTGVSQTSRNARPQNGRSSTGLPLIESAIWTFDSRNYQLTASWMTNSAQLLPATIAYDPEDLHQISIAACPIAYHQVRPAAIAVFPPWISNADALDARNSS
ncbi:hypothetical protein DL93DRAFT_2165520 [Clavulina sp. PMI_390]|nr:hypothetical protein DL93DRAFT_2165520 [Clavulina sp. PMI_390]